MRRVRTNQRTRAPSHVVRERLLARVLAAAKAKRNDAIDAKRAARFLSKRQLAWSDDSSSSAVSGQSRQYYSDSTNIDQSELLSDDSIARLLEAIEAEDELERREAERRQLEHLESSLTAAADDEADLDELLAFQSLSIASKDDINFVKCPNCPSGRLVVMSHGSVLCSSSSSNNEEKHQPACGLRLNSGSPGIVDAVTPDILRTRFAQVHEQHAACNTKLHFETKEIANQQFLVASCAACNREDIVL